MKHLLQINGEKVFEGLYTVMNEYEEIRQQVFVQSTSMQELKKPFEEMVNTRALLNHKDCLVFYTDNCCNDCKFLEESIPSLTKKLEPPRLLPLPSVIQVIDVRILLRRAGNLGTYSDMRMKMDAFISKCSSVENRECTVGFDCEWSPDLSVRVIQLAFSGGMGCLIHQTSY
jgi:hypothetical protein